ncbi:MAG: signal peptide peptidase SppA [Anaerolineae bacterium]|jgi:protease-4
MNLFDLPRNGIRAARNLVRSLRRRGLDYVMLPLEGSFPERAPRRAPLPFPFSMLPLFPSEVSLEEMQRVVDVISGDKRVKGLVFRIEQLQAGGATLHTLRRMILELRASGKHTVAWLSTADSWDYYLASACDTIILPPCARLNVLGLRSEALFLKETLALVGIEADLESIAEYKVAPDMFRRSTMTEPHREMLDAILDSYFEELVAAIAEGRGITSERVRELIDAMPMTPDEAVEADLADGVAYQDELAAHLAPNDESHAPLVSWDGAARWLKRPVEWTTRKRIGVVSLEGMIVPGKSRRMPTPLPLPVEAQAGAETVARALRQAEADPHIAAVVFLVESPGGSSLASDLIWREVRRLRERKPVVVLMGEQAASGGYYVSAAANHIVARPTTMTGSIGIWGGKFVVGKLYDRLEMGREERTRGAMAGFYSELRPFSNEERAQMRQELGETYARFKQIVAEGRGMTEEEVEGIARGRVWTGAQAVAVGLADELGDFDRALAVAKELGELDPEKDCSVVQITPPGKTLPPMAFPADGEPAWVALSRALQNLARERVWAMAPWMVRVRG